MPAYCRRLLGTWFSTFTFYRPSPRVNVDKESCISSTGMANNVPSSTERVMPITWPSEFSTGPPLSPGSTVASITRCTPRPITLRSNTWDNTPACALALPAAPFTVRARAPSYPNIKSGFATSSLVIVPNCNGFARGSNISAGSSNLRSAISLSKSTAATMAGKLGDSACLTVTESPPSTT